MLLSSRWAISQCAHRVCFRKKLVKKMAAVASDGPIIHVSSTVTQNLADLRQRLTENPISDCQLVFHNEAMDLAPPFNLECYFSNLKTNCIGQMLLSCKEVTSTQDFLRANSQKFPDGVAMVSQRQTAGKGRRSNSWVSPEGCLMFSIQKMLEIKGGLAAYLNYVACLAVVEAVQEIAKKKLKGDSLDFKIKWPNDLYSGGLKLGGILLHSTFKSGALNVHVGIGLNISNKQPTTCLEELMEKSLNEANILNESPKIQPEEVLAKILNHMESLFKVLEEQGFGPLEQAYLDSWLHTDQAVEIVENNHHSFVTIKGLSPNGFLLAIDSEGMRFELQPDGNSLDMMNGLIRKRL